MNEQEESESVLLYPCPMCGATHLDPVEDTELAALRQQLAEVNKNWQDAEAHIKLCNKIHAERCRLHDEANEQLATQAAELERLRERCEAAEYVANAPVNLMGDLICGKGVFIERVKLKHCSMWRAARRIQNMESVERLDMRESKTDAYADTIAAGWLPDSKNKGGEYRESALTPQQEPGK